MLSWRFAINGCAETTPPRVANVIAVPSPYDVKAVIFCTAAAFHWTSPLPFRERPHRVLIWEAASADVRVNLPRPLSLQEAFGLSVDPCAAPRLKPTRSLSHRTQ
jgi:hypothetical protein